MKASFHNFNSEFFRDASQKSFLFTTCSFSFWKKSPRKRVFGDSKRAKFTVNRMFCQTSSKHRREGPLIFQKQTGTAFANLGPATSLATPRATTLFWAREDFGSLEAVHEMWSCGYSRLLFLSLGERKPKAQDANPNQSIKKKWSVNDMLSDIHEIHGHSIICWKNLTNTSETTWNIYYFDV